MNYKITVIMSNYNQAHFLPQAIDSVLKQKTDFDVQLIISDDCSTKDNSVEVIKAYADKYPDKIKALLNTENGRYLKNILRAKAVIKTPYFCLLDADDYWTDENYLQDAVNFLEANPDFTIYARNVICLSEQGEFTPYFSLDLQDADFDIESYLNDKIVITQTTGTVFRNIIFSKGIPDIMTNAIGTISERSFEGDAGRYIMHLKHGKAHFVNKASGVYRVLSSGIWSRLTDFEKHAINAQCILDWNEYYDKKYNSFFLQKAYKEWKACLEYLENLTYARYYLKQDTQAIFFAVFEQLVKEHMVIEYPKIKKWKYKIMYKIYTCCREKLKRKGII